MTPTLEYVQSKIGEYNALVFASCLPPIAVKLSRARTFLGKVEYKRKRGPFGLMSENSDYLMRISTMFDLPESEWDDVIIHEMIHYYIAFKGIRDTSTHGKVFRHYMTGINEKYGRHISVTHKTTGVKETKNLQATRPHYICLSLLDDGTMGITVCSRTRLFELYRAIPKCYNVKQMSWYWSMDPFFNKFPRSRTPKVYKISRQEIEEHLSEARKMVCDGRSLRFCTLFIVS